MDWVDAGKASALHLQRSCCARQASMHPACHGPPVSYRSTHHLLPPVLSCAQQKWDQTSDSEKPAAVAIVIAAIVAQVAIGASVDAVERIPLLSPFLEFVGLAVTSVYAYRYATDPAER